jgi:threonine dehydrogenase-like Zn-dependent dehydrogenase
MKALTWQAPRSLATIDVPDPEILDPTDAIVRITSTAICGSDLHLLDVLGPFLHQGDVLGHESMGVVVEVGSAVTKLSVGDRVVIPFVIACGECYQCRRGFTTQCETTRTPGQDTGASLYGYTELYGSVPGGQAEYLRVRLADANAMRVTTDLPDERYLFLSDILPTGWQGVQYAGVPDGGSLVVLGLGPVGQFASRIGRHLGYDVIAVDPVPERRAMAGRHGVATLDLGDRLRDEILDRTDGRGPHAVVDAVGMEAHGSPFAAFTQHAAGMLPDAMAKRLMKTVGTDRLAAMMTAFDVAQRGGTVSLSGVCGGVGDPLPMLNLFDKQISIRMGQCNVQRWAAELWPLVEDPADPLGVMDLVTHHGSLDDAPELYTTFRDKQDGCIKVVLHP